MGLQLLSPSGLQILLRACVHLHSCSWKVLLIAPRCEAQPWYSQCLHSLCPFSSGLDPFPQPPSLSVRCVLMLWHLDFCCSRLLSPNNSGYSSGSVSFLSGSMNRAGRLFTYLFGTTAWSLVPRTWFSASCSFSFMPKTKLLLWWLSKWHLWLTPFSMALV